jgi:predicted enzyme related to lactoylglutathione lyase
MATRDTPWPAGAPCWLDIAVPDVPAALEFYGPVLGWMFSGTSEAYGGNRMCLVDGRAAAGIGPLQIDGQPTAWTVYLASDDVDATTKLVIEHGGSVLVEPGEVGEFGRMAVAADSTGGVFGLWQAGAVVGAQVYNEPGSLVWEDVRLTDVEAGKRFYSSVFGYSYDPVEGAPAEYATFAVNGQVVGGIGGMMGAPEGTPSHWAPYFAVTDVDAAVSTAARGGGTVAMAAKNTPFGRMAVLTDPFGAPFSVHGPVTDS